MFVPPYCPYSTCLAHKHPSKRHFLRYGYYKPLCRANPVPRFRCRTCKRTYSRQTFRADYRDHKPHLNTQFFRLLISGVGLRQSSRMLPLTLRCTELKFRKIGQHLRHLNLNVRGKLGPSAVLQMDEFETFETRRRERPVTVPVLIDTPTRFIIWAESETLSPRGRMSVARIESLAKEEGQFGPRKDNSKVAIRKVLERAIPMVSGLDMVRVQTDEKLTYPSLLQSAFGTARVIHEKTSSRLARTVANPLFPINQTEAIARDLLGRLRRQSWLASKKRCFLDLALQYLMTWKNLIKPRFNRDKATPAQFAGFLQRPLTYSEVLGWRQDQGRRSIPPCPRAALGRGVYAG